MTAGKDRHIFMKRTAKISKDTPNRPKYHKMDSGQKNDAFCFSSNIVDWQTSKVNQRKNKDEKF